MEDLKKIKFLSLADGKRRFKRNVPPRLQSLAGKTAWLEYATHHAARELKEQSAAFETWTSGQMRLLEGQAKRISEPDQTLKELPALQFTMAQAKQIALHYARDDDERMTLNGAYYATENEPNYVQIVSEAFQDLTNAQHEASGDHRTTDPRAVNLLAKYGHISAHQAGALNKNGWPDALVDHKHFQYFCRLIEQVDVLLAQRRYGSLTGQPLTPLPYDKFQDTGVNSSKAKSKAPITLVFLIEAFRNTKMQTVTPSRMGHFNLPFAALLELCGTHKSIDAVDSDKAREVRDLLPRIPAYAGQHYKGKSLKLSIELSEKKRGSKNDNRSKATEQLTILKSLFDFAINEGFTEINPFKQLTYAKKSRLQQINESTGSGYQPFSIEELNRLFGLPLFTGSQDDEYGFNVQGSQIIRRHRYWAPIISLWTGMRMNEILQLEREDIRKTESGLFYIDITTKVHGTSQASTFDKRVKTKGSIRKIPLHPFLIQIGFVEWILKTRSGRLFPEAGKGNSEKFSDVFSKRFNTMLKAAEIWTPREKVFHSLRNNFNDALREAGVPEDIREAINGWTSSKSMDKRYGKGPTVEMLNTHLSRIEYKGLKTDHLLRS